MQFNLIDEEWIPVKRRDGTESNIAPWQVTQGFSENPVVALNAPRPDFSGALIQFLIALVQTVAAPATSEEWKMRLLMPPSPYDLKTTFSAVQHTFELGGDGPRFMQDFEKLEVEERCIDRLLIDMPGENALERNTDHFIKRKTVTFLCPSCCAVALFAMQTNAPAGGVGYRVSLRGGGPLSTLVVGDDRHDTLWHLLWLNVLERDVFLKCCGNKSLTAENNIFPWLAKTRTSEKLTGLETTPEDVHPGMVFWGMPRRIRLNLDMLKDGVCDVCGRQSDRLISAYQEKNYGMNFTGAWLHPLSPYSRDKDGFPVPTHAQPGGVSYRHWLGLVQEDDSNNRMPASIVHKYREARQQGDWQFRLWAFGYDMDKMKARCWYEATIPLLHVSPLVRGEYEDHIAAMIKAASEICNNVRTAVKKAWFKRYKDKKGDLSFIDHNFWQDTEPDFYGALHELTRALESGEDGMASRKAWHETLCREARNLFDICAWQGPIEDADPKRIVIARRELGNFNRSKKIRELLGFPTVQKASNKRIK